MNRPVFVVAGRHRPHEVLLLAVSVVSGLAYVIGAPAPGSLAALLPGWAVAVWAWGLLLSGVVGLSGVWRSLELEAAAMLLGAGALLWYAVAVAQFGWRGLFGGAVALAWASANVWRAAQIRRDLRGIR